ncbi:hypothetical protein GIB67_006836 [Kingdonia uniflora]|uniref:Uncharacterized protein n=1 Tax=Kingdonia uniflora TaxID=39325 RepID=A0A7J7L087_9MAGN|nr:hypothetical protein GIB67_006836 [Kingdonia uniflora]
MKLSRMNEALLGKWLWGFGLKNDGSWKIVIISRFGVKEFGWSSREVVESFGCGVWRGVMKISEIFGKKGRIKVGVGSRVRFWEDRWLLDSSVKELYPLLFCLSDNHECSGQEVMILDHTRISWNLGFHQNLNDWEMNIIISLLEKLISFDHHLGEEDNMTCVECAKGVFPVKTFYKALDTSTHNTHLSFLKEKVANSCFVPVLIGHAIDDDFIRPHHSERIYNAYVGDKNIIKFEGDHNSPRPQFYFDSITIFFHNILQPPKEVVEGNYFDRVHDYYGKDSWDAMHEVGYAKQRKIEESKGTSTEDAISDLRSWRPMSRMEVQDQVASPQELTGANPHSGTPLTNQGQQGVITGSPVPLAAPWFPVDLQRKEKPKKTYKRNMIATRKSLALYGPAEEFDSKKRATTGTVPSYSPEDKESAIGEGREHDPIASSSGLLSFEISNNHPDFPLVPTTIDDDQYVEYPLDNLSDFPCNMEEEERMFMEAVIMSLKDLEIRHPSEEEQLSSGRESSSNVEQEGSSKIDVSSTPGTDDTHDLSYEHELTVSTSSAVALTFDKPPTSLLESTSNVNSASIKKSSSTDKSTQDDDSTGGTRAILTVQKNPANHIKNDAHKIYKGLNGDNDFKHREAYKILAQEPQWANLRDDGLNHAVHIPSNVARRTSNNSSLGNSVGSNNLLEDPNDLPTPQSAGPNSDLDSSLYEGGNRPIGQKLYRKNIASQKAMEGVTASGSGVHALLDELQLEKIQAKEEKERKKKKSRSNAILAIRNGFGVSKERSQNHGERLEYSFWTSIVILSTKAS